MTWTYHLTRTADDISTSMTDPYTTAATVVVDTCGVFNVTAHDVLAKLAASDTAFGLRLQVGLEAQKYSTQQSTWVDLDPVLESGPMLVRTLSVTEHPDRRFTFVVEYEATAIGPATTSADGTGTRVGHPFVTIATASRPRTANAYRMNPTVPTDPNVNPTGTPPFQASDWNTGTDIGGTKVDVNTSPLPIPIDQTVVTITYPTRYPYLQWDGSYCCTRDLTAANDMIGGRNTREFLGFEVGSLLFESIDVQPLHHEYKLVSLVFVYDEWHHAQQVPLTLPQFATPTYTDTTTGMSQALTVFWQQPYLNGWSIDTSTTWLSDDIKDYLETFGLVTP